MESISAMECQAQKYRLQKINEIQTILTDEAHKRTILSEKYHRWVNIIDGVDDVLVGSNVVLEAIAVALLAAAVSAQTIIPIQVVVTGIGALATVGSQVKKKLSKTEGKHEKIAVLAQDKLSAIGSCMSKALDDEEISDEEYSLIVSEFDKFREMKEEIRTKVNDELIKQRLLRVMTAK